MSYRSYCQLTTALLLVLASSVPDAHAQQTAKTPQQVCQGQALTSIAKQWPNVMRGQFDVNLQGNRCLVFLQADSDMYQGKRSAWLIDGKTGDLLAEFFGAVSGSAFKDSDQGSCSFKGGKFPSGQCTWGDYLEKAQKM